VDATATGEQAAKKIVLLQFVEAGSHLGHFVSAAANASMGLALCEVRVRRIHLKIAGAQISPSRASEQNAAAACSRKNSARATPQAIDFPSRGWLSGIVGEMAAHQRRLRRGCVGPPTGRFRNGLPIEA